MIALHSLQMSIKVALNSFFYFVDTQVILLLQLLSWKHIHTFLHTPMDLCNLYDYNRLCSIEVLTLSVDECEVLQEGSFYSIHATNLDVEVEGAYALTQEINGV